MLSKKSQRINKTCWYYEEKAGIDLTHEIHSHGNYLRTDSIKIPWKMLRASLARHDYKQKPL